MRLPAFARRDKDTLPVSEPDETASEPRPIMRFLTRGGAAVNLHATRFTTRWLEGPPTLAVEPYEIAGFQWKCDGCDAYGREGDTYHDPHYRAKAEARADANEHADNCWALPKPTA